MLILKLKNSQLLKRKRPIKKTKKKTDNVQPLKNKRILKDKNIFNIIIY